MLTKNLLLVLTTTSAALIVFSTLTVFRNNGNNLLNEPGSSATRTPSVSQQALDRLLIGETIRMDEILSITEINSAPAAEIWCNRHQIKDPVEREKMIRQIIQILNFSDLQVKIAKPLTLPAEAPAPAN